MAQGSHATLGGWEPKTCAVCGKRVLVKNSCWFHWNEPSSTGVSLHPECNTADPERGRAARAGELVR